MSASRTILITGATGFVGKALVSALAARGDRIVVVSRDPARAKRALPAASAFVSSVEPSSLEGVDGIVNLAGEPVSGRWNAAKKRAIEASRVEATSSIVKAIGKRGEGQRPRVLV